MERLTGEGGRVDYFRKQLKKQLIRIHRWSETLKLHTTMEFMPAGSITVPSLQNKVQTLSRKIKLDWKLPQNRVVYSSPVLIVLSLPELIN